MTGTELVQVRAPRRPSVARRILAGVVLCASDVIRIGALLTAVVVTAANADPRSDWNPDAPWPALVVILLALLGVERIGLAVRSLSEWIAHPSPYTPRTPKHPAH